MMLFEWPRLPPLTRYSTTGIADRSPPYMWVTRRAPLRPGVTRWHTLSRALTAPINSERGSVSLLFRCFLSAQDHRDVLSTGASYALICRSRSGNQRACPYRLVASCRDDFIDAMIRQSPPRPSGFRGFPEFVHCLVRSLSILPATPPTSGVRRTG